jgi:glycosyltransferase involved in cell wall biosynthesis
MTTATRDHIIPPTEAPLRYSVVVPVYNEADNIRPLLKALRESLPPRFEALIVYDFEGDSTLPAIERTPADEKPRVLRTVLNDIGPGVRNALEKGLRSARAPVVLVTMADLSDDYSVVDEMIRLAENGADVVCASRYMRGGRQIGGPLLKGLMSRVAGLTLHWFAGLPTHDATNSFRAYRKDFIDRTTIESKAGFALALELTVKAHVSGGRVAEVPATWRDRSAGESRFRILAWLPEYLRWYFRAFRPRRRVPKA